MSRTIMTMGRPEWLPFEEFPFTSRYLNLAGHRIHYIDEGEGPLLLFVHAGPSWLFVWRDVIAELRSRFRCVALDFPDAGLSTAFPGYSPGLRVASTLLQRFIEHLALSDITMVVHDVGGPIGFHVAGEIPDRFVGMAVTGTFAWPLEDFPQMHRMIRLVGSSFFQGLNASLNILGRSMATRAGGGKRLSNAGKKTFSGPFHRIESRRAATAMLKDIGGSRDFLQGVEHKMKSVLKDIPMLLIYGENDPGRKVGFQKRFQSLFPQAHSIVIERGHHFPQMDAPYRIAQEIALFRLPFSQASV